MAGNYVCRRLCPCVNKHGILLLRILAGCLEFHLPHWQKRCSWTRETVERLPTSFQGKYALLQKQQAFFPFIHTCLTLVILKYVINFVSLEEHMNAFEISVCVGHMLQLMEWQMEGTLRLIQINETSMHDYQLRCYFLLLQLSDIIYVSVKTKEQTQGFCTWA